MVVVKVATLAENLDARLAEKMVGKLVVLRVDLWASSMVEW